MKRTHSDPSRRRMLLALGLFGLAGCWGSFNLTGRVYDWNGSFGSKWASWAVFVVFILIPVYGTLLFIDAIVLNTIEFFSGNNPVHRNADLGNGHRLVMHGEAGSSTMNVEHYEHDRLVRVFKIEKLADDEVRILDRQGRARLHVAGHRGGARLRDEQGRTVADLARETHDAALDAGAQGLPLSEAVGEGIDAPSMHRMMATSDRLSARGWV